MTMSYHFHNKLARTKGNFEITEKCVLTELINMLVLFCCLEMLIILNVLVSYSIPK